MIPLHKLAINPSAPPEAIQLLIELMIKHEPTDINVLDLMMKTAKDTAATDNALRSLCTLVPDLPTTLLGFFKRNPTFSPDHVARVREVINLKFVYEKTVTGLNDDPRKTPDRLGYAVYAKAIAALVAAAELRETYYCVGIYAPWGVGKSTLFNLLRIELKKRKHRAETKDSTEKNPWLSRTLELWMSFMRELFGIVGWLCCLVLSDSAESDEVLPAQMTDDDAVLDAREMEKDEVVALVFVLLLPIWIVFGIMICLLKIYGKFVRISSRTCNFSIFALTLPFGSLSCNVHMLQRSSLFQAIMAIQKFDKRNNNTTV